MTIEQMAERIIQEASDMGKVYEAVESTPIPRSIKQAREEGWQCAIEGIQIAVPVAYSLDQQAEDRKRVVRLSDVVRTIRLMEYDQVKEFVVSPVSVFWATAISPYRIGLAIIEEVGRWLWSIITGEGWRKYYWKLISRCWMHTQAIAGVTALVVAIKWTFTLRSAAEARLRRKALPQRGGRRYWRKKMTRQ